MDEALKRRLIGATVLVSLAVIFVPMLLQHEPVLEQEINSTNIPPRPDRDFSSRVLPAESDQLALPPGGRPQLPEAVPEAEKQVSRAPKVEPQGVSQKAPKPSPVAPEPRVGLSAWIIQVGSFSHRANAEKLLKRLRTKGFSADIEQASVKGKTMFRVLVGPEVDRKRAESMLARLDREVKSLGLKGRLKSYP